MREGEKNEKRLEGERKCKKVGRARGVTRIIFHYFRLSWKTNRTNGEFVIFQNSYANASTDVPKEKFLENETKYRV